MILIKYESSESRTLNMKIVNLLIIAPLIPFVTGCSVLEKKEVKEYEMTWAVERDQENDGHFLVEFEFVNFPGHKVGHFSNALIEHLENKPKKEIVIEFELTYSIFGKFIGFREKSIDGVQHYVSTFSYFGTEGDPPKSPF